VITQLNFFIQDEGIGTSCNRSISLSITVRYLLEPHVLEIKKVVIFRFTDDIIWLLIGSQITKVTKNIFETTSKSASQSLRSGRATRPKLTAR